ncbi:MAG: YceI family protein [Flavobacteriaceae bacterium]|nr:YceI family protein [Flavobacteriaceae bacterium]
MRNLKMNTTVFILSMFSYAGVAAQEEKEVNTQNSKITWKGHKVAGSHEGTIQIKEGSLVFDKDKLKGGKFTADMTSISNDDLSGEWKEKLEGHLRSEDFFNVDEHPESKLIFTNVEEKNGKYLVTAELTIKEITNPVTFEMELLDNSAKAKLKIDRTKYEIRYGSASFFNNLKDKAISNEFDLEVALIF